MFSASWKEIFLVGLTLFSTERRKYYADKIYDLEKRQLDLSTKTYLDGYSDSEVYLLKEKLRIEKERFERSFNSEFSEAIKKLTGSNND